MNNIDIRKISTAELKSLAYDVIVSIGNMQKNLDAIQQEIGNRGKKAAKEAKKPETEVPAPTKKSKK